MSFVADRLDNEPKTEGYPDAAQLKKARDRKQVIINGTTRFNEDPKKGIAFFAQNGVIENVDDPVAIAKFLKGTSRVSKKVLGEFLTKRSNGAILDAFLDMFDLFLSWRTNIQGEN